MNDHYEFDEREMKVLREAISALPREVAPHDRSWSNIQARIEASRVRELRVAEPVASRAEDGMQSSRRSATTPRSWMRSPLATALVAASVLVAVTTFVVRREGAISERTATQGAVDTARTDMRGIFARYDGATADLASDFAKRRARLNPETVAVMDSCLTTIDNAIHETRSALAITPDNATIAELLEVTYQQKLDLLRRAAELSEVSP